MSENMIGVYGEWAAGLRGGALPELSFRREEFTDVDAWRAVARERALERLAGPEIETPTEIETVDDGEVDGVSFRRLRWQLPYGPATDAVLLRPVGETGELPGVLALHCHGGQKSMGWQKIARIGDVEPVPAAHHEEYYGGVAWANELARRGYAVLVPDAFAFASRRVRMADCPSVVRFGGEIVEPDLSDPDSVIAYNAFASQHEGIMAKSLFCAGTTWPGVFAAEDRAALGVLADTEGVDADRLGCAGLSGGGLRTVMLAGLDERIKCCSAVGFMSTWRDFLLAKCHTHTWMLYVPGLANELDFPEILGLRAPAPTMVQNSTEDQLFTLEAVRESKRMLETIFAKAGAAEHLAFNLYPGPHKFDLPMQKDAFDWMDRWLKG